jgi:cytochrome P450
MLTVLAVAIIPRMHTLTGAVLDSEMGRLTEWKGFNAGDLTAKTIFEVSGPIVFGENLVKDTRFINIMHDLAKKMVIYAFLLRWFNIPVVGGYLIHAYLWTHRRNLATAAQCIEEEIARREQLQHSADDCVQWVMDPDIPSHMRKPDRIVKCLINLGAGMIDAPGRMLVNLLYDLAAHPECVNEIRAEIFEHAGADGWNADSIAKMKKFDSFIHESSRLHPLTSPCKWSSLAAGPSKRLI